MPICRRRFGTFTSAAVAGSLVGLKREIMGLCLLCQSGQGIHQVLGVADGSFPRHRLRSRTPRNSWLAAAMPPPERQGKIMKFLC